MSTCMMMMIILINPLNETVVGVHNRMHQSPHFTVGSCRGLIQDVVTINRRPMFDAIQTNHSRPSSSSLIQCFATNHGYVEVIINMDFTSRVPCLKDAPL